MCDQPGFQAVNTFVSMKHILMVLYTTIYRKHAAPVECLSLELEQKKKNPAFFSQLYCQHNFMSVSVSPFDNQSCYQPKYPASQGAENQLYECNPP